ncbi:hypothetical protein FRB90_011617 [Tulasnella sp. 427]|nr:hypothetical protein FRB90_011617 [Tulasnella sp. 427]
MGQENPSSKSVQPTLNVFHSEDLRDVHRFKVDEVERTVICTTGEGGLYVVSIDTDEVLWKLPEWYVTEFAHVEYDRGFIIFTRLDQGVEVWRRSADSFNPETYLPCQPDPIQVAASPYLVPTFPPDFPPRYQANASADIPLLPSRGVYLPFTILHPPSEARCSRFVYPHLLLASQGSGKAYIWDVPSSTLIETIDIPPPSRRPGDFFPIAMTYVELSSTHVFVCWTFALAVYRRPSRREKGGLVLTIDMVDLTASDPRRKVGNLPCPVFSTKFLFSFRLVARFLLDPQLSPPHSHEATTYKKSTYKRPMHNDWISAVHVSPDGQDLVAVTRAGWVLWLPDFARMSSEDRSRTPFRLVFSTEQITYIDYMAFDGDRILLAIDSWIVSVELKNRIHPEAAQTAPQIRHLVRLPGRGHLGEGRKVSCLQLHSGSAWFTYVQAEDPDEEEVLAKLAYVDMTTTRSQPSLQESAVPRSNSRDPSSSIGSAWDI